MLRKNINITHSKWKDALSLVCLAVLHWSSLDFACGDFTESNRPEDFLWYSSCFVPLLKTHANSVEPCGFFWAEPLL